MTEKARILVGTPAYNGQMQVDYVLSLLGMSACGLSYALYAISNDSLVSRARNTILARFHAAPEFTHLFYLDADVGIRGEDVRRLLEHDRDVIGAPVRIKSESAAKPGFSVGEVLERDGTLATVSRIATAALLLSRRAVDALVEKAVTEQRSYAPDALTLGDVAGGSHYDVFQQGVVNGAYISEDYQVCADLRSLGFRIHADLAIRTRHVGMHAFSG